MCAVERLEVLLVPTDEIARDRQELEIVAAERGRFIREGETAMGIAPRLALVGGASAREVGERGRRPVIRASPIRDALIRVTHPPCSDIGA